VSFRDILKSQLIVDEGLRLLPYTDTVGKLTVGVGRNLTDRGITREEAMSLLDHDIADAETTARLIFPNFDTLSDNRKAALTNMAFNLGATKLGQFVKMRDAIAKEDFNAASREMLSSSWAVQVGNSAVRLATMMRQG